jgi:hypothetical protein
VPNHSIGDLLHALEVSRPSHMRAELLQLAAISSLAPHPVRMQRQREEEDAFKFS